MKLLLTVDEPEVLRLAEEAMGRVWARMLAADPDLQPLAGFRPGGAG